MTFQAEFFNEHEIITHLIFLQLKRKILFGIFSFNLELFGSTFLYFSGDFASFIPLYCALFEWKLMDLYYMHCTVSEKYLDWAYSDVEPFFHTLHSPNNLIWYSLHLAPFTGFRQTSSYYASLSKTIVLKNFSALSKPRWAHKKLLKSKLSP